MTPADMDLLSKLIPSPPLHPLDAFYFTHCTFIVGGPDRPPSKHMIEQMRQDEMSRQAGLRGPPQDSNTSQTQGASEQGYWAYMQRQVQLRTENLNIMGDSMNRLEESSSGWADDVNKYVKSQKKKAVLGGKFLRKFDQDNFFNFISIVPC